MIENAKVRFVLAKNEEIRFFPVGKVLEKEDIPDVSPDTEDLFFDCFTSDKEGRYPLDPVGFKVTGDATFFASYYSSEKGLFSADAVEITRKEGGAYNLPKGKIIFYGASNFTFWHTLAEDFKAGEPSFDALNHGIGGATDRSLLANLSRLVIRYQPSVVVIQCSGNDVGKFDDDTCKKSKEELYRLIRQALPEAKIMFVCHMPLPGRAAWWMDGTRLQNLNLWVKDFCASKENCFYLDVWEDIKKIALLKLSGEDESYFRPGDKSHMSPEGQKVFCAALKREISKYKNKEVKEMEKVLDFLKSAGVYYLATVEGDQPRVRPFGTINLFEGKLYIQTGKVKPVAKQIQSNPKAEICAFKDGKWLRVSCELVEDDRMEARKAMLDAYPDLRRMYDENDGNTEVFYLKNAIAVFSSFTSAPETVTF